MLENIGYLLLVTSIFGIGAHTAVEFQAGTFAGHEGEIATDTNTVVPDFAVEDNSESTERDFDASNHAAWQEAGLLIRMVRSAFSKLLLTMLGGEVVFDVDESAAIDHPIIHVTAVARLVEPSVRCTVAAEDHHSGMVAFGSAGEKIEGRRVIQENILGLMRRGITSGSCIRL